MSGCRLWRLLGATSIPACWLTPRGLVVSSRSNSVARRRLPSCQNICPGRRAEVSMQCLKCGTANPTQARFCLTCGEKLGQICSHCGRQLPGGARFCLECGARVAIPETVPRGGMAALSQAVLRQIPKEYVERLLATRGQPHDEWRNVARTVSPRRAGRHRRGLAGAHVRHNTRACIAAAIAPATIAIAQWPRPAPAYRGRRA